MSNNTKSLSGSGCRSNRKWKRSARILCVSAYCPFLGNRISFSSKDGRYELPSHSNAMMGGVVYKAPLFFFYGPINWRRCHSFREMWVKYFYSRDTFTSDIWTYPCAKVQSLQHEILTFWLHFSNPHFVWDIFRLVKRGTEIDAHCYLGTESAWNETVDKQITFVQVRKWSKSKPRGFLSHRPLAVTVLCVYPRIEFAFRAVWPKERPFWQSDVAEGTTGLYLVWGAQLRLFKLCLQFALSAQLSSEKEKILASVYKP